MLCDDIFWILKKSISAYFGRKLCLQNDVRFHFDIASTQFPVSYIGWSTGQIGCIRGDPFGHSQRDGRVSLVSSSWPIWQQHARYQVLWGEIYWSIIPTSLFSYDLISWLAVLSTIQSFHLHYLNVCHIWRAPDVEWNITITFCLRLAKMNVKYCATFAWSFEFKCFFKQILFAGTHQNVQFPPIR